MSIISGITLNGNVCLIASTHSLITQICCFILGTCSLAVVVLRMILAEANSCFIGTNLKATYTVYSLHLLGCLHELFDLVVKNVLGGSELN